MGGTTNYSIVRYFFDEILSILLILSDEIRGPWMVSIDGKFPNPASGLLAMDDTKNIICNMHSYAELLMLNDIMGYKSLPGNNTIK